MISPIVVSVLVAVVALAFVLAPLFRKDAAEAERVAAAASVAQELQSKREMVLAALKDLEDDRATAKISDEDYEELNAKLTAEAVDVMKRIDELEGLRPGGDAPPAPAPRPVPNPRGE